MRTIEEYMKLPYKMEIVPDIEEGGYVVFFPDLPGCLTIGDTVEEAIKNAEDAKYAWFEAAMELSLIHIYAYQSGFLEGTTPTYEAYMQLKKSIAAALGLSLIHI